MTAKIVKVSREWTRLKTTICIYAELGNGCRLWLYKEEPDGLHLGRPVGHYWNGRWMLPDFQNVRETSRTREDINETVATTDGLWHWLLPCVRTSR
jgi:hypothetical protein